MTRENNATHICRFFAGALEKVKTCVLKFRDPAAFSKGQSMEERTLTAITLSLYVNIFNNGLVLLQ